MSRKVPVKKVPKQNETIEEKLALYKEIFALFDKNNDKKISTSELSSLMIAMGRSASDSELGKFIEEVDTNKSGEVDFDEFIQCMDKVYCVPENKVDEVVEAFQVFDIDRSGDISYNEFKNILTKYGNDFSDSEIDELFKMIDLDGDRKISYAEFVNVWKYQ